MADAKLIETAGLHAWYGTSHILHGLDFHIGKGETVGLLDRNGMGKSTLIRSLLGHVKQREGSICVAGRDVSRGKPHEVTKLGVAYVPEGRGVFPNLSVCENLIMAERAGVDGRRDWTVERVLDTFPRLKERLNNGGAQLSGGEQQILSIGRALLTNPDCLILDEANEGLAPLIVREIWRVIGAIRDTGIATLVVDRNYCTVLANSDRAVVMAKGRIVLEDSAAALAADDAALASHLGV
ncbi:MAG: ABC transporter ATP-binding protein [Candidatus Protistobacter heckmanni]|nr:ABC transporter ATP-binding protein [Candidatus Protistobacter heckmanni]